MYNSSVHCHLGKMSIDSFSYKITPAGGTVAKTILLLLNAAQISISYFGVKVSNIGFITTQLLFIKLLSSQSNLIHLLCFLDNNVHVYWFHIKIL